MNHLGTAAFLAVFALCGATAAGAQSDPMASRAENQINSLNRSMSQQQQLRGFQQQGQFEANALRNELSRQPAPPLVPSTGMGAPMRR